MFKLRSNGGLLETLVSLHLKSLIQYSTTPSPCPTRRGTSLMADFLVKSLGFSRGEASNAEKKVSVYNVKTPGNYDSVVVFLRNRGLNNTQIKKIVYAMPDVLWFNVERTLEPKFNTLVEMGVNGPNLVKIISSNPSILRRGLSTRVVPMINFLKSVMGSDENFHKVLRRSYWLMSSDVETMVQPNLELLRSYGFSDARIRKFLLWNTDVFGHEPKKLENILVRVEEELGIHRDSSAFGDGIVLLASMSENSLKSKHVMFKSLGWTESDIKTMIRKHPRCLMLSEAALDNKLKFFQSELGCEPEHIASRPYVLTYSMEDRVLPRYAILRALKEKKLIKDPGIVTVVCTSDPHFLQKYVLPFKNELPLICEAYIHRKKGSPSVEAIC